MLQRAIVTANAGQSSFASILHAAASRAWLKTAPNVTSQRTRRNSIVSAHRNEITDSNAESSAQSISRSRVHSSIPSNIHSGRNDTKYSILARTRLSKSPHPFTLSTTPNFHIHHNQLPVSYLDANSLQDSDFRELDTPRSDYSPPFIPWSQEFAIKPGHVGPDSHATAESLDKAIPTALSKRSLYRNLVKLSTQIRPTLGVAHVLDYHDRHPGFRSARSYNLLITLALRHSAFGTAQWLFLSMNADEIPYTLETYKLRARFLARLGRWDDVVKEFNLASTAGSQLVSIPPPIWAELLTIGKVAGHKHLRSSSHVNPGVTTDAVHKLAQSCESRFGFLMQNAPDSAAHNLSSNTPRVVASVVTALLKYRQSQLALSLAHTYLRGLPSRLSERVANQCLNIIHPLVTSYSNQQGLASFYESRRTLRLLLRSHQSLRPTSTTLFLLLRSLTDAKRCGTVAERCIDEFKKLWGEGVLDRRVRRRLASFAVKEGRMDLVDDVSSSERLAKWQRSMWQLKGRTVGEAAIPPSSNHLRPQLRKFFPRNGAEQRKWCLLEGRIQREKREGGGEGGGEINSSRGIEAASTEP